MILRESQTLNLNTTLNTPNTNSVPYSFGDLNGDGVHEDWGNWRFGWKGGNLFA